MFFYICLRGGFGGCGQITLYTRFSRHSIHIDFGKIGSQKCTPIGTACVPGAIYVFCEKRVFLWRIAPGQHMESRWSSGPAGVVVNWGRSSSREHFLQAIKPWSSLDHSTLPICKACRFWLCATLFGMQLQGWDKLSQLPYGDRRARLGDLASKSLLHAYRHSKRMPRRASFTSKTCLFTCQESKL